MSGSFYVCKKNMKLFNLHFAAAKSYFLGFATSGVLLFSTFYYLNLKKPDEPAPNFTEIDYVKAEKIPLKPFNPNELDEEGWKNLGFTENKIATILKYKDIVGGNFTSKKQLKKCYAISAEKFSELEPFILLPDNSSSNTYPNSSKYSGGQKNYYFPSNHGSFKKKELKIPGKFNPDHFAAEDFVKMGFTENQANSILKYKSYLGGSFISKEKFKACFIISDENYRKMQPYLLLPEKTPENFENKGNFKSPTLEKPKVQYVNFDPNTTDFEGWKKLGFSEKQAQVIVNYRDRNLRGSFKTLEDIEKCFVISPQKFSEMKSYIILNPDNFKTSSSPKNYASFASEKTANLDQETKTDFSKIDLNKITYKQMMEFGFDGKSAGMMLGYRKKLGGFMNRQQIMDTYDIDKDLAQKLCAVTQLDNSTIQKYTLVDAPEEWLKNHPYFKYSADKIIYFRTSEPNEKKIWKFIKVKPEYEARMKLYLK